MTLPFPEHWRVEEGCRLMKVFFSAATAQKEELEQSCARIVVVLKEMGHEIVKDTTADFSVIVSKSVKERTDYYKKVIKWIARSDVVVIEASYPSTLDIGHEITIALEKGKQVLGLYQDGYEPSFLLGLQDEKLIWVKYSNASLVDDLKYALDLISEKIDTRFNFFISPKIGAYLDWVSKKKRAPRAVYLRRLIEEDMKQNKEYEG